MNKIIFMLTVLLGLVLTSCSSDEPVVTPDLPNQRVAGGKYRKSIDEALSAADRMFVQIDRKGQTRSSSPRRVESVQVIGNSNGALTRGAEADTMLYLVNYADGQGFALLSSDWRAKPVYAISDEGSLNLSDTTFNKGLALFMDNARGDYYYSVHGPGSTKFDSIRPDIDRPVMPDTYYDLEVYRDVKPILTYHQSRWDQEYPFYRYTPVINGIKYPVGCVAVALTQLLSTKGFPTEFEGRNMDWQKINNIDPWYSFSQDIDNLFFFMAIIGEPDYLNMSRDNGLSGSNPYSVQKVLVQMGLANSGVQKFSGRIPEGAYPVLMAALNSKNEKERNGHAWVLDGGYYYKETADFYVDGSATYYFEHCVWGWGGKANGYYSWSSKNGFGTKPHHYDENDDKTSSSQTGDFVEQFEYIYLK